MNRRRFVAALLAEALVAPLEAAAQPTAKPARVGLLLAGSQGSTRPYVDAFRRGLRDAGYSEGRNISIEARHAGGLQDRVPALLAELVRSNVDVIVVDGTETAIAAKAATTSIPIVFALAGDPVGSRLVASLAQPGGNLTGLSNLTADLSAKQLQLLKEAFPQVSRIAVFFNPSNPATALMLDTARVAARGLPVELQLFQARRPSELRPALTTLNDGRVGAVLVLADALFRTAQRELLIAVAEKRLPGMYPDRQYVEAEGLMSYGPRFAENFYRAAAFVDKILKGARPGELPVEQPTRLELVINARTAKALGFAIPPSVLLRADQVIE